MRAVFMGGESPTTATLLIAQGFAHCAILRSHYLARQMNFKLVVAETNLCRRLLGATSEGLTLGTSCCDHELTRSQDGKIGSKDGCKNHGEVSNQDDKGP